MTTTTQMHITGTICGKVIDRTTDKLASTMQDSFGFFGGARAIIFVDGRPLDIDALPLDAALGAREPTPIEINNALL